MLNNRPSRLPKIENASREERLPLRTRAGLLLGRLSLAAACVIPVADLATGDAITAKEYEIIQENITLDSKATERGLEVGGTAVLGIAESLALGQVIARRKNIRSAYQSFEDYQEEKRSSRGGVRNAISRAANTPLNALYKLSNTFERAGERIAQSDSKFIRKLGRVAIDAGHANAVGTSTMVLNETMAGKPTSLGRQTYLGGLVMGSWLTVAEGIRQVYRSVPVTRPPLATLGRTYELLTTVDVANPLSTPVGSLAITSTAAALAYTGWKIEEFRQHRQELIGVNETQLSQAIYDYEQQNPPTSSQ